MKKIFALILFMLTTCLFAQNENKIGSCMYEFSTPGENPTFLPTGKKEIKFNAHSKNKQESCQRCTDYFLSLPLAKRTQSFEVYPSREGEIKTIKINDLSKYDVKVTVTLSSDRRQHVFCSNYMKPLKGHSVKFKLLKDISK